MKRFLGIFLAAGVLFSSCGLDDVITLVEPSVTKNDPLYSSIDFLTWYCSFITEDEDNKAIGSFSGTEVYYKIYNNYSALVSQRNAILSVNTTSNSSAAATRMIDTYTYQTLGCGPTSRGNVVFVPRGGTNQEIKFRVKTYKGFENYTGSDIYSYRACIVGGNYGDGYAYVPYRSGNTKSFDFFDDDDDDTNGTRDVEPESGDSDFYYSSSVSASDTYYVQFFAVAVAFDETTLSNTYSLVLDLGSVPIIKGK